MSVHRVTKTKRGGWEVRWRDTEGRQRSRTFALGQEQEARDFDARVHGRDGSHLAVLMFGPNGQAYAGDLRPVRDVGQWLDENVPQTNHQEEV